jgi:toxin ParE1/3/4
MTPFKLSAKAKSDLKDIAKFTHEQWGRDQRNIYIKQFDDSFHMLADSPEIGKSCDFVRSGYLKFPQGSHVIFYKIGSSSKIEIIRILHKSMDVTLNLKAP